MSLTSCESASTGTTDSTTSKMSFASLSGQYGTSLSGGSVGSGTGLVSSGSLTFSGRRGNIKYSSARFNPPPRSLRGSKRRSGMSSFGRSTRRTAARPARTKGVFEKLLSGLAEGVEEVRGCIEEMKVRLEESKSRVNYYRDLEKQVKGLERKVRTLEVHRDRIEEMRDEYTLKLKLREGAFNIAQALSNQTSKAAKEKLQEARAEQRDLLEDLCDIEDELETKLGVFKVHINELVGLGRAGSGGDIIETQLKLGSQKWKAKCRVSRHEQTWQDEDIIFLGKIMDELFVKVVEVKKIQGNVLLGNMKCQTREFFSFLPMTVTFDFPTSTAKLSMDVRWSPTIGEDFLSDLDLRTVQCIVGGALSKSPNHVLGMGSVERLRLRQGTHLQQIRHIAEPVGDDLEVEPGKKVEVKPQSLARPKKEKKKKRKKDDSEFVFMDRQSIIENQISDAPQFLPAATQERKAVPARSEGGKVDEWGFKVMELSSSPKKHHGVSHPLQQDSRDSSLGSNNSSGSGRSGSSLPRPFYPRNDVITLLSMLEAVLAALEEPKELYTELYALETQLIRLDAALRGGQLIRAPSMTLSESQAMDTFEFLGSEDNLLAHRLSRASIDLSEGESLGSLSSRPFYRASVRGSSYAPMCRSIDLSEAAGLGHRRSNSAQPSGSSSSSRYQQQPSSGSTPTPTSGSQVDVGGADSRSSQVSSDAGGGAGSENGVCQGSSGSSAVDRALMQHLIHCESLLVHLHSSGPLKHKLSTSLRKLLREAEVISELLNIAAEPKDPLTVDHILPELVADDQLMGFWRFLARDDVLSVSYEQFAVGLDEKFGQSLWSEFPDIANKVLTVLLSRILDLETEDWELDDGQMIITIFQYSSYFLSQGSKSIAKCLREVAQELNVTEGLESNEMEVKRKIAAMLPNYGYNKGALLAASHLLGDSSARLQEAAFNYIANFVESSPWHSKAVQCLVELLEHSDQKVRIGACNALAELKATSAASQLKYLSRRDFDPVREAASRALQAMGNPDERESSVESEKLVTRQPLSMHSLQTPDTPRKHSSLQRTRSAELSLST